MTAHKLAREKVWPILQERRRRFGDVVGDRQNGRRRILFRDSGDQVRIRAPARFGKAPSHWQRKVQDLSAGSSDLVEMAFKRVVDQEVACANEPPASNPCFNVPAAQH
ncbi:MAG TPA: hypothetical protein VGB70_06955 [Allosphingosinicella sp.]|jgi:hypothetical protein